ncbi:731_t:CDS:2 [Ambispora leptoticha]|uniref:731_t:CDS:1 n=1 Tax=Ambispora leptoticha TaxID=144679 RepID=A0A9N9C3R4_9GLOM|nr:731_t:CDS:2 [Ambispora leptoticha]
MSYNQLKEAFTHFGQLKKLVVVHKKDVLLQNTLQWRLQSSPGRSSVNNGGRQGGRLKIVDIPYGL